MAKPRVLSQAPRYPGYQEQKQQSQVNQISQQYRPSAVVQSPSQYYTHSQQETSAAYYQGYTSQPSQYQAMGFNPQQYTQSQNIPQPPQQKSTSYQTQQSYQTHNQVLNQVILPPQIYPPRLQPPPPQQPLIREHIMPRPTNNAAMMLLGINPNRPYRPGYKPRPHQQYNGSTSNSYSQDTMKTPNAMKMLLQNYSQESCRSIFSEDKLSQNDRDPRLNKAILGKRKTPDKSNIADQSVSQVQAKHMEDGKQLLDLLSQQSSISDLTATGITDKKEIAFKEIFEKQAESNSHWERENFQMPVSWKHFDYTELMELLSQYKRSKVHYIINQESDLDDLKLLVNNECPHRIFQSGLGELHQMDRMLDREIDSLKNELKDLVLEMVSFKPSDNVSQSIKLTNHIQIACTTKIEDSLDSTYDYQDITWSPLLIAQELALQNKLPNFAFTANVSLQEIIDKICNENKESRDSKRNELDKFEFYPLYSKQEQEALKNVQQICGRIVPYKFDYEPALPVNEGLLCVSRIKFMSKYDKIRSFMKKTKKKTYEDYNAMLEKQKMQTFKWNSMVRRQSILRYLVEKSAASQQSDRQII
ncbi:hypothetical protein FGO68_gene3915 [Halteria grandinella]|uniref:Uncharacterized protein n=1 Tax=Halteria grandinella TaxID=5974 RepID=A0A8J8P4V9_HALGN|nr:hypothetical protein FGO68_gene3915 [Halteria grandinella]